MKKRKTTFKAILIKSLIGPDGHIYVVLVYTKAFHKDPCFILWYDDYYPTFGENVLGMY